MKLLKYLGFNATIFVALYLGIFKGVDIAMNVAYFILWFSIIASFIFLREDSIEILKKEGRSVPAIVNNAVDAAMLAVLIIGGLWVTVVFFMIRAIIVNLAWDKAEALKEGRAR